MNASFVLLALSLAAGAPSKPTPSSAPAAETPVAVERVRLEVDHSPLLAQQMAAAAEKSGLFVREDVTRALRERHGVDVVDTDSAPAIIVKLAWKDYENSVYLIAVGTRRQGEDLKVAESFEATCINNSALTEVVLAKLPAALEQLEARNSIVAQPDPEPMKADPIVEPPDDVVDDEPRRPLGNLGRAGIGVGVVGLGALVGGGIVYAQGRRPEQPPGRLEEREGRDFKPPGIALMVSGGAALVTGAVLLIVDRTRARRSASALVFPSPNGLVVAGRF